MPDNNEVKASFTPEQLKAETNRLIEVACTRAGISPADVSDQHVQAAVEEARKRLEHPSQDANSWKSLYEAKQTENEALKASLAATRSQTQTNANDRDAKPSRTYEQARAQLGAAAWAKLDSNGKILALNQDPTTLDHGLMKTLFGRGANHVVASDLLKTNKLKYLQLREAALALNIYGA